MSFDWKFVNLCAHYRHESVRQFYFELERNYVTKSRVKKGSVWVPMRMSLPGKIVKEDQQLSMPELLEIFEAHDWGLKGIYPELLAKGTPIAVAIPMRGTLLDITGIVTGVMRVIHQFLFKLDFSKAPEYNEFAQFVSQINREESIKYYQMTGHERRRYFRLPCVIQVPYKLQQGDKWIAGQQPMMSFNISIGGLGVETQEKLVRDQPLTVSFTLHDKEFSLPSKIVWIENVEGDLPQYGVEFTQMSKNVQDELMDYIMSEQQRRQRELERRSGKTKKSSLTGFSMP